MPTVAEFDGIKIEFYYAEHPPPHFHARYAEFIAQIEIEDIKVLKGELPRPQLRKVVVWAAPRRELLRVAWQQCEDGFVPDRIS